ncbi:PIN domain-containing protein [Sphingomonas sp.]|uniref:PIN domain-containing protein n=1 Tax=Sphingomonas sp. TaxID=28214 RepID=UPI002D7E8B0F|nr:PIN domain-containing protein [Sphingomonas sp.]HEU0043609.1 PIN domain-containing protein [Sphingomonas sp.]
MTYLLDTSVAIHLRDREPGTLDRLLAGGSVPYVSLLTLVELEGGVTGAEDEQARRRTSLDALALELRIIGFDAEVVGAYREIIGAIGFSRRRVIDRLIAATALVHDLTIITMNGADFRDVPDLKLEIWPAPGQ